MTEETGGTTGPQTEVNSVTDSKSHRYRFVDRLRGKNERGDVNEDKKSSGLTGYEKLYNLLHRKEAKENRNEVKKLSDELMARIDYDAIFAYYGAEKQEKGGYIQITGDEIRDLRAIANGISGKGLNKLGAIESGAFAKRLAGYKAN